MATFVVLGKYTKEALAGISKARTEEARKLIQQEGGSVSGMYALLGPYDLLLVVNLPTMEAACKVSVGLSKLTGISFTTCPALTVEAFDNLVAS